MEDHTTSDKRCKKCGRTFPRTLKYFAKQPENRDGFEGACRECRGYRFLPDPLPAGSKRCSKCKQIKEASETYFNKDATSKDGLTYYCRVCASSKAHDHYWKDPEARRKLSRRHRREQPEYYRAYLKAWRAANKAYSKQIIKAWISKNYERKRDKQKEWDRNNRPRIKVNANNRRARERQLANDFTAEQWTRCLDYWDHRCCICGTPKGLWVNIVMDHWIPVADPSPTNPGTTATNMLPLCHPIEGSNGLNGCNASKWMHDPVDWLIDRLGEKAARKKLAEIETYFAWVREQS